MIDRLSGHYVQLHAGDVLIAVGTEEELRALDELFAPARAVVG